EGGKKFPLLAPNRRKKRSSEQVVGGSRGKTSVQKCHSAAALGDSDQGAPLSTILAWTELYDLTALLPTHAAAQLTRALGANAWGPALRTQARLEVDADAWTSAI